MLGIRVVRLLGFGGVGSRKGLWDPKWDRKNSGCLAGNQRMGEELWPLDVG